VQLRRAPPALIASIEHRTEILGAFDQSTPALIVCFMRHSHLHMSGFFEKMSGDVGFLEATRHRVPF
jgi:hypothetical protein